MNEITSFIDSLDLGFTPTREGNGYVILLDSSDDFSSVYNKLFLNDDLEEDDQKLLEDVSYFVFTNGNYEIIMSANYDTDRYEVRIGER